MKEKLATLLKKTPLIEYAKLAIMLIGFGIAIGRMEYKFDSGIAEVKGLMEKHVIEAAGKEKLFELKLANLEGKVNDNLSIASFISDFIRPDEVNVRRRR